MRCTTCPIGRVVSISKDKIEPADFPEQIFNYVGLEHIEGHTGRILPHDETAGRELKSTKHTFHKNEILYGKLRPYLNKVHLAVRSGICSTDILVIKPTTDTVLPAFIAYYLRSPALLAQVERLMQGANLPRLSPDALLNLVMPVPSLSDQARLVSVLDKGENLRLLRGQADHRTADLIPALFHEMFGDPTVNDHGYHVATVESVFSKTRPGTRCGPFGSALKKHEYVADGVPVWGIDNVRPNEFAENGSLFITAEKYAELKNYAVESGDILISRAGTVGRMCVARPRKQPSIIGTNLIRVSLNNAKVVPEYVSSLFTYFGDRVGKLRAASDEGAYSFVQTGTLKSLTIPLPPIALQRKFAERLKYARDLGASQAESRQRLNDLFQSLLYRAFRGNL